MIFVNIVILAARTGQYKTQGFIIVFASMNAELNVPVVAQPPFLHILANSSEILAHYEN